MTISMFLMIIDQKKQKVDSSIVWEAERLQKRLAELTDERIELEDTLRSMTIGLA